MNLALQLSPSRASFWAPAGVATILVGVAGLTLYLGLPFYMAVALTLAGVGGLALASRPRLAIYLAVALSFMPALQLGPVTPFQLAAALAVFSAGLDMTLRKVTPRLSPLFAPYLVFAGLIVFSLTYVPRLDYATLYLYVWIRAIALFLLLVNYVVERRHMHQIFLVILVMASGNALQAMAQQFTIGGATYRADGWTGNPNAMAAILAMSFPLAFSLVIHQGPRWRRVGGAGLSLLLVGGIVLSCSRGGTAALFAAITVLAFLNPRRWRWFVALALVILACLPLVPDFYWRRVADVESLMTGTVDIGGTELTDRGQLNRAAIRMWSDHPWLGVGTGQYIVHLGLVQYNPGFKPGMALTAHNTYLQALSENGVIGLGVVLAIIFFVLGRQYRTWRYAGRHGDEELRQMAAAILAMTTAILTAGLTADFLYSKNIHLLFALTVCLASLPGAPWGPKREVDGD